MLKEIRFESAKSAPKNNDNSLAKHCKGTVYGTGLSAVGWTRRLSFGLRRVARPLWTQDLSSEPAKRAFALLSARAPFSFFSLPPLRTAIVRPPSISSTQPDTFCLY